MYDVKPLVKQLLDSIPSVKVSDTYPKDWSKLPCISFYEIANIDPARLFGQPLVDISIQVDIWHDQSTGALASQVDEKMNSIGFRRPFAADVPDPSGVKHKTMRYRGLVDTRQMRVYQ